MRSGISVVLASLLPLTSLVAQTGGSRLDRIWGAARWYESDVNPVVSSVLFSGRFQYDYATVSGRSLSYDEWNVRRLRLGVRAVFFGQVTVHAETDLNPQEADPFYVRLTDAYLEWSRIPSLAVTVGKHSAPFTLDGATSSKELLTLDRSNLANNMWFPSEYMPGVSVSGTAAHWVYHGGVYSAGAANREFGDFDGSAFALLVAGYDFAEALGVDEALVRGSYVRQGDDPSNTFTRQLGQVGSLNLQLESGDLGMRADVAAGAGYQGQSDLWGSTLMPSVNVTSKLQLVGRVTYLSSEGQNGVRLARYESQHTSGRGDRYRELYVGSNYFFYGHKLKLQSGLAFADMRDRAADGGAYSGVSLTTGLRVSW